MNQKLDTLHSGKTKARVLSVDRPVLTTLSTDSNVSLDDHLETVFVLESEEGLDIDDEFLSYEGLRLLSDPSNYELSKINRTDVSGGCTYCTGSSGDLDYYLINERAVLYGHYDCMEEFSREVDEIREMAKKYVVSSEI